MYPPPYKEEIPKVTPPTRIATPPAELTYWCNCGLTLPHASACTFSLDPEAT